MTSDLKEYVQLRLQREAVKKQLHDLAEALRTVGERLVIAPEKSSDGGEKVYLVHDLDSVHLALLKIDLDALVELAKQAKTLQIEIAKAYDALDDDVKRFTKEPDR